MSGAKKNVTLGMKRPSRAAERVEEGEVRLNVVLPESIHRALKIRVAEQGTSLRDYILTLLARDGIGKAD